MYAAKLLSFVHLGENGMHAFVKFYVSALANDEREFPAYQYGDMSQHISAL